MTCLGRADIWQISSTLLSTAVVRIREALIEAELLDKNTRDAA
jgi:hypothetical protein